MMISFDEYGINFQEQAKVHHGRNGYLPLSSYGEFQEDRIRPFRYNDPRNYQERAWKIIPMMDAIGLSSVLFTLIRHADRVKIGCMTGGIRSAIAFDKDHAWCGASYFPYYQMRHYGKGNSILPAVESPTFCANGFDLDDFHTMDDYQDIPYIDAAASHDEEKGEAAIFVINRNWEEEIEVKLDLRGFEGYELVEHQELYCDDMNIQNSYQNEQIHPVVNNDTKMEGGIVTMNAKKLSFNMIRLKKR